MVLDPDGDIGMDNIVIKYGTWGMGLFCLVPECDEYTPLTILNN